jgi:hypothetical protein
VASIINLGRCKIKIFRGRPVRCFAGCEFSISIQGRGGWPTSTPTPARPNPRHRRGAISRYAPAYIDLAAGNDLKIPTRRHSDARRLSAFHLSVKVDTWPRSSLSSPSSFFFIPSGSPPPAAPMIYLCRRGWQARRGAMFTNDNFQWRCQVPLS